MLLKENLYWVINCHTYRRANYLPSFLQTIPHEIRYGGGNMEKDVRKRICGAKTRQGKPCKKTSLKNGRCRFHGGKSTGPKNREKHR